MIILFIGRAKGSAGEIQHLRSFVKQLEGSEFLPIFLFDHLLERYYKDMDMFYYHSERKEEIIYFVQKFKPSLIICCEYSNLYPEHKKYLDSLNIPVVSMNGIGMRGNRGRDNLILFRPCPVNEPVANTEYEKYWNLYPEPELVATDRKYINQKFQLQEEDKNVLFSIAPWAYSVTLALKLDYYYGYLLELLTETLCKLDLNINFFVISPLAEFTSQKKRLKVLFRKPLDNFTYDQLLMSADLVISDNIIQTSLSKAFISGRSPLALTNTRKNKGPVLVPEFNMFPMYHIIFPDNLYSKNMPVADIFEPDELLNKIEKLLSNRTDSAVEYREKCKTLPSATENVKEVLKQFGII